MSKKSSNMKQLGLKTGIKTSKKRKMINKFTIIKIKKTHQYYEDNSALIKTKSRNYRAENKDFIQSQKSQHYD